MLKEELLKLADDVEARGDKWAANKLRALAGGIAEAKGCEGNGKYGSVAHRLYCEIACKGDPECFFGIDLPTKQRWISGVENVLMAPLFPAQEALVNSWRERADKDKADCMDAGKFKTPTHRAAWNFADGLHTAAGELEAALGKNKMIHVQQVEKINGTERIHEDAMNNNKQVNKLIAIANEMNRTAIVSGTYCTTPGRTVTEWSNQIYDVAVELSGVTQPKSNAMLYVGIVLIVVAIIALSILIFG